MRIGQNPNIKKELDLSKSSHRVIIPIYIPNSEGYFEGSFDVLKTCVHSLIQTINADTKITLISNASSDEVNEFIGELYSSGKIDRAVFNAENVGKMNAIIAEARASFETYVTYSDADVFFDKGWLKQTYTMFDSVRSAGFVSMNPTPKNMSLASSTIVANFWKFLGKAQRTSEVCDYSDLEHFHRSIGKDEEHTRDMFDNTRVTCVGDNYIIGAGHFCCTVVRSPVLDKTPRGMSNIAAAGGSENVFLDVPLDKTGLWRLSSPKAYVWHMGNILDKKWADEKLRSLEGFKEDAFRFDDLPGRKVRFTTTLIPYNLRPKIAAGMKKFKLFD